MPFLPRHSLEMSGQLNAPAGFNRGKTPRYQLHKLLKAHSAFIQSVFRGPSRGVKRSGVKLTTFFYLVPKSRVDGSVPPLSPLPSWCLPIQNYVTLLKSSCNLLMQNTRLEHVAMPVVCKWNIVNLECVPIKQMQMSNTQYHLITRLLLFMIHSRTLSVPLITYVCTFYLLPTHTFSLILSSILVSYVTKLGSLPSPNFPLTNPKMIWLGQSQ